MSVVAYVWSLVCCSFDVSTTVITCPPLANKRNLYLTRLLSLQHQRRLFSLLPIKDVSKVSLGGLVAVCCNLGVTMFPCPLNLSIILSDTQRSLRQCVRDRRPTYAIAPGALLHLKALKLDYNTGSCSEMRLDVK